MENHRALARELLGDRGQDLEQKVRLALLKEPFVIPRTTDFLVSKQSHANPFYELHTVASRPQAPEQGY
jgi:hypothetical protein